MSNQIILKEEKEEDIYNPHINKTSKYITRVYEGFGYQLEIVFFIGRNRTKVNVKKIWGEGESPHPFFPVLFFHELSEEINVKNDLVTDFNGKNFNIYLANAENAKQFIKEFHERKSEFLTPPI